MAIFLIALLVGFTVAKTYAPMAYKKYPPLVECQDVADLFESIEVFEEHAEEDKESTMELKGRGYYHCYC